MTKPSATPTASEGGKERDKDKDKVQTGGVGKLDRGTKSLKLHNVEVDLSLLTPIQPMPRPRWMSLRMMLLLSLT